MEASQTQPPAQPEESSGWRPADGDVLSGKIVAVSKAWSDWTQSHYPLITVHDTASGRDVDVHAFHQTLRERLMETKPKVGDAIEIAYVGKRRTRDGQREVAVYRVNVPGADGSEVWGQLDREPVRAAQAGATGQPVDDDIPF